MGPLTDFSANELATGEGLLAEARTALAVANDGVAAARTAQAQAATALAALLRGEAQLRAQLPAVPMPGDADALADSLEQAITRSRAQNGAVVTAAVDLGLAELELELAQARLTRFATQHARAVIAKADADARAARLAAAATALAAAPLATVRADATAALANSVLAAARQRVDADLPAAIAQRARDRRAAALVALATARTAADTAWDDTRADLEAHGGDAGKAAGLRMRLERAEAAYEVARHGRERLDGALASLARVVAAAPLTAGEQARIARHADEAEADEAGEATVPDTLWRRLHDLEAAEAELVALAATDVTALSAALDSAEIAYAKALRDGAQAARKSQDLAVKAHAAAALADLLAASAPARTFSATRGDS